MTARCLGSPDRSLASDHGGRTLSGSGQRPTTCQATGLGATFRNSRVLRVRRSVLSGAHILVLVRHGRVGTPPDLLAQKMTRNDRAVGEQTTTAAAVPCLDPPGSEGAVARAAAGPVVRLGEVEVSLHDAFRAAGWVAERPRSRSSRTMALLDLFSRSAAWSTRRSRPRSNTMPRTTPSAPHRLRIQPSVGSFLSNSDRRVKARRARSPRGLRGAIGSALRLVPLPARYATRRTAWPEVTKSPGRNSRPAFRR